MIGNHRLLECTPASEVFFASKNTVSGVVTKDNNLIRLTSTTVKPEERGKGIASKMLEEVFNYFRKNNYKVIIECSYVNKWILDKKDYQDLIVK